MSRRLFQIKTEYQQITNPAELLSNNRNNSPTKRQQLMQCFYFIAFSWTIEEVSEVSKEDDGNWIAECGRRTAYVSWDQG